MASGQRPAVRSNSHKARTPSYRHGLPVSRTQGGECRGGVGIRPYFHGFWLPAFPAETTVFSSKLRTLARSIAVIKLSTDGVQGLPCETPSQLKTLARQALHSRCWQVATLNLMAVGPKGTRMPLMHPDLKLPDGP